jgi:branched-chain amino acid transport system ATP-binding protein
MLLIKEIAITYQNTISAVRGVSIEVPDQRIVALLGANGAGKTTILRAIGGLLRFHNGRIDTGTIELDGQRIDTLSATSIVRKGIGQCLEGRRLFGELTVDENLRAGALVVSYSTTAFHKAYDHVMDLFPVLRNRRHTQAGYLSGGEQQMVAIGRSLMSNPRVLLLDEPSLGLAPMMIQQLSAIISQISADGTAVLLVEQNLQMAKSLASYIYVLETGKVAMESATDDISHNDPLTKYYLGVHESEQQASYSALRQSRMGRKNEQ